MKRNFYLQHSLSAMLDERMQILMEEEGLKGYGAYWFIIEKLSMLPQPCASLEYLKAFCHSKKIPLWYIKKIITDYRLFDFLPAGQFTPCELNPARNLQKEVEDYKQNIAESVSETPVLEAKNDENRQKVFRENPKKCCKKSTKTQKTSDLQKTTNTNTQENIKEIVITTTTTKENKETTAAAAKTLHPIRPWQELVDNLAQESSWLDLIYMQSGYSVLLKRNIGRAIQIFKRHIEMYDKGGDLLNMSQVHGYFVNYVRAGSRTSTTLRELLLDYEAKHPAENADHRYRHEQCIDGKRTYLGCPIPHYAPPRPDENAIWNDSARQWVTKRKANGTDYLI